jgi:hypothetical protein
MLNTFGRTRLVFKFSYKYNSKNNKIFNLICRLQKSEEEVFESQEGGSGKDKQRSSTRPRTDPGNPKRRRRKVEVHFPMLNVILSVC